MEEETIENYINAKERLAICVNFGVKITCGYIREGKAETCLECHNYQYLNSRTLEEINDIAIMSSLLLNAD